MGMDRPAWADTVQLCQHGYVLAGGLGNGCLTCYQDEVDRLRAAGLALAKWTSHAPWCDRDPFEPKCSCGLQQAWEAFD